LLHGTDALAFPKDGSLIYKLLGPEQQDDFARGWGVSYGAYLCPASALRCVAVP
jgi:hypothetical protein